MREPGFYWVSLDSAGENPEPVVAYWESSNSTFGFDGRWYKDSFVKVLSEQLEPPVAGVSTLNTATDVLFREAAKAGYRLNVKFTRPRRKKIACSGSTDKKK